MSPRYVPSVATIAPPVSGSLSSSVDRYVQGQASRRQATCDASRPYNPSCELHSWFRDLAVVAASDARAERALTASLEQGGRYLGDQGDPERDPAELREARERLRVPATLDRRDLEALREPRALQDTRQAVELRDLSASSNPFIPLAGPPTYLADAFSVAAAHSGSLAAALPRRQLPSAGMHWEVPRFTSDAAVAVQASENSAIQETDPATALASSNRAWIAGFVDASQQSLDLSPAPGLDEAIARSLGAALGAEVDKQLVYGTNSSGETRGMAQVSGINAVTFTSASPTVAELSAAIWEGYGAIAAAGVGPAEPGPENYAIVMHPRRRRFLGKSGTELPDLPGRIVVSNGVRTNISTNQDEVFVVALPEVFIGLSDPEIQAFASVGSSTLTARIRAHQEVASMFGRQPKAISRITGTGLVAP